MTEKESLSDNISTTELVLNMLAETATKEISEAEKPEGFEESRKVAGRGGKIAGNARKAIEEETGSPVITSQNAARLNYVVTQMIEASAKAYFPGTADHFVRKLQREIEQKKEELGIRTDRSVHLNY